jgi:adenine phosphoribosyltransferase
MNKAEIHKYFKSTGSVILPVIHVLDVQQTSKNINIAINEGAAGVFLINHDFSVETFLPIIKTIRTKYPFLWLGVNFLGVPGDKAFPVLGKLQTEGTAIDGYWADDACIDERTEASNQAHAQNILDEKTKANWDGLYLGGTAFKKQREVDPEDYEAAARIASQWMDVVMTSGQATGCETPEDKIASFRRGAPNKALGVASGVSPANIHNYSKDVDIILVATGINYSGDFYNIDPLLLRQLLHESRKYVNNKSDTDTAERADRWYLTRMSPRSRGEKYAWLDPSSSYINAQAFHTMLDDLLEPYSSSEIDVVAGFDAAGFVLGAAMATRLGKGFLTLRKGGKIPVTYDVVPMTNYSGQTQELEMRKPAFAPGTRVLLVDQWIETGGTMDAGIRLVERQHGIVAGIAAVCLEENDVSNKMRATYKVSSCVLPGTEMQRQCNSKHLEYFSTFNPECIFPDIPKT